MKQEMMMIITIIAVYD